MPSRRAYLTTGGTALIAALAGCAASDQSDPPAGSLRFSNRDSLPHEIRLTVTGAGAERGEARGTVTGEPDGLLGQPSFSTTAILEPGTERLYEDVFSAPAYYAARHTVDEEEPANSPAHIAFNPAPPDREYGYILEVLINRNGVFGWGYSSTNNLGRFTR